MSQSHSIESINGVRHRDQHIDKKSQSYTFKRSDSQRFGHLQWTTTSKWILFILICVSIILRCYHIVTPQSVAFDEVHTGTEINHYLKHEFFFDYNPPLGKLLLAGVAYISGYDGSFSFEYIGKPYTNDPEGGAFYISLRAIVALFGAAIPPLLFITLMQCDVHHKIALFASCVVLFDNASCLQSKFIIHDAFYYVWIVAIAFTWLQYKRYNETLRLCISALFVGCAMSTKYIGWSSYFLFLVLEYRNKKNLMIMALIPLLIYTCSFYLHLSILYKSGPGSTHVSVEFQKSLHNDLYSNLETTDSRTVQYMDYITLLNLAEPIHLHSHEHNYPLHHQDGKTSSQGQQVTGYDASYIQNQDIWIIEKANGQFFDSLNNIKHGDEFSFNTADVIDVSLNTIHNNDTILLKHYSTEKYLLTHDVASPLTKTNMEVTVAELSSIPVGELGDILWRIEFCKDESVLRETIQFHLVHVKTGVKLNNHQQNLPDWGFQQREVNGARDQSLVNAATKWTINHSSNKFSEYDNSKNEYVSYSKFSELHRLILSTQWNLFTMDKSHPSASCPITWPLFTSGISMWDHLDTKKQIYFLPNLLSWWLAFVIGIVWSSIRLLKSWIASKKRYLIYSEHETWRLETSGRFLFYLYLSNYLPYLLMFIIRSASGNEAGLLFIHYYMPSFVLSCLLLGLTLDGAIRQKGENVLNVLMVLLVILAMIFIYFLPMTLMPATMTVQEAVSRQWLPGWNFAVLRV